MLLTGQIGPGGTVVEGTAGNTGIGLAHMCLALGYKCVIYMPDSQSQVGFVFLALCLSNICSQFILTIWFFKLK